MNKYQSDMYRGLMKLTHTSKSFFHKDHIKDEKMYRCFCYRMTDYSDFCLPYALECRGHMFLIVDNIATKLVSLPIQKFFNLGENESTQNIDLDTIKIIMDKKDGSLISTYIHDNELFLKSKNSLSSDQAMDSQKWLLTHAKPLYDELTDLALFGYTVNMEWTSPDNRIVLNYVAHNLTVLNIRNNNTGECVPKDKIIIDYPNVYEAWVGTHTWKEYGDPSIQSFVDNISSMENIEGFVIETESGQKVKIKTDWYLERHRMLDIVNVPKRLFIAIVNETIDDVKSLCYDNENDLKTIFEMEQAIQPIFNGMIDTVEKFYQNNKELCRKDYAIKAQSLNDGFMALYMNEFIGRENDYKEFAVKNYERFITHEN